MTARGCLLYQFHEKTEVNSQGTQGKNYPEIYQISKLRTENMASVGNTVVRQEGKNEMEKMPDLEMDRMVQ